MLAMLATTTLHASEVSVTVNGIAVDFAGQPPTIVDGRTLVPVRGVFEHLGFDVDWNQDTLTATLQNAEHTVIITAGSAIFTANGNSHNLDVAAQIIGGRTMLPIRAVLESVGYAVDWDATTPTVIVSTAKIPRTPVKVAASRTHSMALHTDGSLWIWGENSFGQLGNGHMTTYSQTNIIENNHDQHTPIRLKENIIDIAAGDGFSLAINSQGELFAWGANNLGQLGDGTNINRADPVKIMDDAIFVDARGSVAIAITSDGTLWRWGSDITGWGNESHNSPVIVMSNITTAAASSQHILMVTADNQLYGIGQVSNLGIYDGNPNFNNQRWPDTPHESQPVHILPNIRAVSANDQTSFAITTNDRLYGWGPNSSGDVGSGSNEFWVNLPEFVMADVQNVFSGSMALANDGSLWIWGAVSDRFAYRGTGPDGQTQNFGGFLKDRLIDYGAKPQRLMDSAMTATGSAFHFLAIDGSYNLYSWGQNQFGQLGTGRANVYRFGEPDDYHTPIYYEQNNNQTSPVRIGSVN